MHPAPPWFAPFYITAGAILVVPVFVAGSWLGSWRRAGIVSGAMAILWGVFFVLFTRVGLPPTWITLPITFILTPLLLWKTWPQLKAARELWRVRLHS